MNNVPAKSKETQQMTKGNTRPWGRYDVLSTANDHQVKSITVLPGKRLSLQAHERRSEHWVVVRGAAVATLDERAIPLAVGEHVFIEAGGVHRMENPGSEPLVFVEVQVGDYFGEDDIVRFEDDFGRVS